MDLRQLEILRAIAETGSFTKAGVKLHVSQSAISRQILLLEEEFGEPLFIRSVGRVQMTPTGEALLQLSHRIFADIRDTASQILDHQRTLTGTLTIGGGMTVGMYVFPALLREFSRLHPAVEIKVVTSGSARMLRQLRAGTVDLALLTLPITDTVLRADPVMREEMLLVLHPAHPLAKETGAITAAQLHGQSFITFESGSNTRRVIDEFFVREQIAPRVVAETENVEIAKAMVGAGLGISLVPFQAIAREAAAGTLRYARVAGPPLVRTTGWVRLQTARVPRMVQAMMETLTSVAPHLNLTPDADSAG